MLILLLIFFPFFAYGHLVQITLEHAKTPYECTWGLMGRSSIPNDYGMLFSYSRPRQISMWAFNCFTDLDVAFLDKNGLILEIVKLKAHPDIMDPSRPVKSLVDLTKYPPNDPIIQFFQKNSITSQFPSQYVLETRYNFFMDNNIKVGDSMQWDEASGFISSKEN